MRNWSTDAKRLKSKHPKAYVLWKLEQQVNFGLAGGKKINPKLLREHFSRLNLDPDRRKLFTLLLRDEK